MALVPGKTTLTTVRTIARQRADMVNSQVITDAEWNSNINASAYELFDLLVTTYGEDYESSTNAPYTFTTDGTNERYALPDDFLKCLGAEVLINGQANGAITLKTFARNERNQFSLPGSPMICGVVVPRYRIDGNYIWLIPRPPPSGQIIRLDYVPRFTPTADSNTITFATIRAGDNVAINGLNFGCVASGPVGNQFLLGATDTLTAVNCAAAINAVTDAAIFNVLTATSDGAVITLTLVDRPNTVAWSCSSERIYLSAPPTWSNTLDGVSGWEEYVVLDVLVKAMVKQDLDARAYAAQKAAMKQRIEDSAPNRDAAGPLTGCDTSGNGGMWGGWGYDGGGGW